MMDTWEGGDITSVQRRMRLKADQASEVQTILSLLRGCTEWHAYQTHFPAGLGETCISIRQPLLTIPRATIDRETEIRRFT